MTEEELQALHAAWITYAGPLEPAIQHVRALLAEVYRLRAVVAAMRQALSDVTTHFDAVIDQDEWQGATDAVEKAHGILAENENKDSNSHSK